MNNLLQVANVSQIQSNRRSQVYTIRTSSNFDSTGLRLLQSMATAVLLIHKAGETWKLARYGCSYTDYVQSNALTAYATSRLLQLLQLFNN